jgi:hypothetical protein
MGGHLLSTAKKSNEIPITLRERERERERERLFWLPFSWVINEIYIKDNKFGEPI